MAVIARASLAGSGNFSSVLAQIQKALSDASGNQKAMTDLLAQKGDDFVAAGQSLGDASETSVRFGSLLNQAGSALSGVTPFVACDIQTGTPTASVQGKELVTGPLDDAVSAGGEMSSSAASADGAVSNRSSDVGALPDRASLVSSEIQLGIGLIEEAKGLLQPGDPRLDRLNAAEKLLQDGGSAGEKDAAAPFLAGYQNTRTLANQASQGVGQAASTAGSAQQAADALSCQGDCGQPSPIDGTYSPNGTGTITGFEDANQAIYDASNAADALAPSLQQASSSLQDLQGQLNPLAALFNQVLSGIGNARAIIDGL